MKETKRMGKKTELKDWSFFAHDAAGQAAIESMIRRSAAFAFDEMTKPENMGASFPAVWKLNNEKRTCDPLDVDLEFLEGQIVRVSIRAAIASYLDDCREDESFSEGLSLISAEFRKLAKKIDKAIDSGRAKNRAYEKRTGKSASISYEPDA